jgi:hypothetical protein
MRRLWLRRGRLVAVFAASDFLLATLFSPVFAQIAVKRRVLGTLHVRKQVEIATAKGAWHSPKPGAALVEGTSVRTGKEGAALLDLGQNGVLGLYPNGRLLVGTLTGQVLPVAIEEGEIAFRLPPGSKLELRTARAIVHPSGVLRSPPAASSPRVSSRSGPGERRR